MSSSGAQFPIPDTPADGAAIGTRPEVAALLELFNGSGTYIRQASVNQNGDGGLGSAVAAVGMYGVASGLAMQRVRVADVFKTISTVAVGAEATIWTPGAGKKFRLMGFVLALSAATTLTLRDNTAGAVIGRLLLPAGGPGITVNLSNGILSASANNVLTATSGAAANLDGMVFGTEE